MNKNKYITKYPIKYIFKSNPLMLIWLQRSHLQSKSFLSQLYSDSTQISLKDKYGGCHNFTWKINANF